MKGADSLILPYVIRSMVLNKQEVDAFRTLSLSTIGSYLYEDLRLFAVFLGLFSSHYDANIARPQR